MPELNNDAYLAPNRRVTQREIAEFCGLHQSAVSFALRGDTRHVTPETIDRVNAAATELGYVPHQAARRLAMQRFGKQAINRLIMLIFPHDFHHQAYFLQPYLGAMDALMEAGFDLLTLVHSASVERLIANSPTVARGDVDAIVAFSISDDLKKLLAQARAQPTFAERPFVSLIHAIPGCSAVAYDDEQAYEALADHLLALGHRHLLALHIDFAPELWQRREAGLRRAYARRGLDAEALLHDLCLWHHWLNEKESFATLPDPFWMSASGDLLSQPLSAYLRAHPQITGIVAWNDITAWHAWAQLADAGLRVPEEISITGCDDYEHPFGRQPERRLTTIRLPLHRLGEEAVRLAIACVRGAIGEDRQILLPGELIPRDSTAPPGRRRGGRE